MVVVGSCAPRHYRIALLTASCQDNQPGPHLPDECPEGLRQWEWYYLKRLCRVEPVVLTGYGPVNEVRSASRRGNASPLREGMGPSRSGQLRTRVHS